MKKLTKKISFPILLSTTTFSVHAATITWVGPSGGLFTNSANWSPAQVPGATDIAQFSSSAPGGTVNFTNGGTLLEGEFQFLSSGSVSPYTLTNSGVGSLEFQQGGVSNTSGVTQFITMQTATLNFINSATASNLSGTSVQYDLTNNALNFLNTSGAGNAVFNLSGAASIATFGGTSTGDSATFNLTNSASFVLSGHDMTVGSISSDSTATIRLSNILSLGNSSNQTISGTIVDFGGGAGALRKIGTGTLTLSGTNTNTGITNIFQGTLAISSQNNLGSAASVNLTDTLSVLANTTISKAIALNSANSTINTNNNVTLSGVLSGSGALNKTGTGILTVSGLSNTYTGGTVISQGAVSTASTTRLGTGNITINGGELDFTSGETVTKGITLGSSNGTIDTNGNGVVLQGLVTGAGRLTKIGSGTLTLSGTTNDYAGGNVVNAGTLIFSSDANLGAANSSITLNGGSLGIIANNVTSTRDISLTGSNTIDVNTNTVTFSGTISGTGSLTKIDGGTLALTGTNTYTGGTTVSQGILRVSNGSSIGTGNLAMAASTTLNATGNLTLSNPITAAGALTIDTDANTLTLTGGITGAGLGLTKTDTGTLVLSVANTNIGTTTVSGGTLRAIPQAITGNVNIGANAMEFMGTGTYAGNLNSSAGASVTIRQAGSVITFTGTNNPATLSIIEGATLVVGNNNNFGVNDPPLTISDGSTLRSSNVSITDSSGVTIGPGGAIFDVTVNNFSINGAITGAGNDLTKTGAGNLLLGGTANYGNTLISAGRLQGNTANLKNTITNNATLTFLQSVDDTFTGNITGTGAVQVTGSGDVTFPNANTYSGITTISSAGTAIIGTETALGTANTLIINNGTLTSSAPLTFSKAIQLTTSGSINTIGGDITLSGDISGTGILNKIGTGTLTLQGNNSYTNVTQIGAGTLAVNSPANIATTSFIGMSSNTTFSALASFTTDRPFTLNANSIINTNANNLNLTGILSGNFGSLIKTGTGTLTLSAANTYVSGTIINQGTVEISSNDNLGSASSLVTFNGGALSVLNNLTIARNMSLTGNGTINTNANTLDATGVIDGVGTLIKEGTGLLTLSGVNTYSGGTTINSGTVAISSDNNLGNSSGNVTFNGGALSVLNSLSLTRNVSLTANGTINTNANTLALSGVIDGAGALIKEGSGVLTLSGLNTYSGGTAINSGIIEISGGNNLGSAGTVVFNGGALSILSNLTLARNVSLTADGTVNTNANTIALTGVIDGAGTLIKEGSGVLTLSGNNTYTGGTEINTGLVEITSDNNLGDSSGIVTFNGGELSALNSLNLANDLSLVSNGTINTNANTLTSTGIIDGSGELIKDGSGVLALSANNTYAGGTTINSGTVEISSGTNLGSGNVNFNGGALSILNNLTLPTSLTLTTNGTINTNANAVVLTGVIDGAGELIKEGSGILTLSGANTYSGGTTINSGTLEISSNNNLGNSSGDIALSNSTLSILSSLNSSRNMTLTGNSIINTNANSLGWSGVIDGTGALIKEGTGTLTLSGINTYAGGTFFNEGAIAITTENNLGPGPLTFNGGTLLTPNNLTISRDIVIDTSGIFGTDGDNLTLSGVISGPGSLVKEGTGVLTLTGNNTYAGGTNLNAGILDILSDANLGSSSGNIIFDGGTLRVSNNVTSSRNIILNAGNGTFDTNSNTLDLSGEITGIGVLNKTGLGTLSITGTNSYSGGTVVSGGVLEGTTTSLQGNITNNTEVAFVQNFSGTYSGNLSGIGEVIIDGGGEITFTGINSYSGITNVLNGSTLIGNIDTLPANINLNGASTLQLDQTFDGIFSSTLTGDASTFFDKYGTGTLTINTDQSGFLGTTTVYEGKISLNATIGGNFSVPSGILGGVGTVGGNLDLSGSGTVAPANSIGVLTVLGNYVQTDGTLLIHINGAGESSLLDVSGTATISGDSTVSVTSDDGIYNPNFEYLFLQAAGGITGNFANVVAENPLFNPEVIFNGARTQAFLSFGDISFLNIANTENEIQVATQLDSITDPTAAQQAFINALTSISTEAAQEALNQMTGQQYANLLGRAQLANRQFIRSLYNPVRERLTFDPRSNYDPCLTNYYKPGLEIWAQGSIGRGLFEGSTEARSVRISQYEVSVGAHTNLNESFLIGAAISYLRDNVRYTIGGHGENNTILGGLYGLYHPSFYYILADFVIGHSNDFVSREISIGDLTFNPSTNVGMFQTAGYFEIGIDRYLPNLFVQPFFGIEVDYNEQDRLTERSGTPLDMTFESRPYKSAFGRLGGHFTPQLPFWDIYVTFDAAFDYRFNSTRNRIHGFFNDFGSDFTIIGTNFDRYGFDGSVFISKTFPQGVELFIEGSGFIGDRTSSYEGTIGIMLMW